jgi:hypothetical protein
MRGLVEHEVRFATRGRWLIEGRDIERRQVLLDEPSRES